MITKGQFENLELGAGTSDFGARFFPVCCLTEKDKNQLSQISSTNHINYFFDAYNMPAWTANIFKKVIMCNPYHYGFRDREEAQDLIQGIVNSIDGSGEIIVISHDSNLWGRPKKVKRAIELYAQHNKSVSLKYKEFDIVASNDYKGFTFYDCLGTKVTIPNKRVIIDVTK